MIDLKTERTGGNEALKLQGKVHHTLKAEVASKRPGQGTITLHLWPLQCLCLFKWKGKPSVESNEGREAAGGALTLPWPLDPGPSG